MALRNRIVLTGHDTHLAADNLPGAAMNAYYRSRARGGAGLIVIQVVSVHETARDSETTLMATDDTCIPTFREMIAGIHAEGARVIVQLFHPGRELLSRSEGILHPSFAPSPSPSERHRSAPTPLGRRMISEIVESYGAAARRMDEAGADGVEIVASHGYLPAQFTSSRVNTRADGYGGSPENRLRFSREVIAACRGAVRHGFVVGMRLSLDDRDMGEVEAPEAHAVCAALAPELDYLSLVAGTAATSAGAAHIVPSMAHKTGYLAHAAQAIRKLTDRPIMLTGRINQPQDAEQILADGDVELVGMTRAMICDPEMPAKARDGRLEDIRACIGCNQACIGHYMLGLPISCIQTPQTGRELRFGQTSVADQRRKVVVVGGGVAGMKAAATAAARGHDVVLFEASSRLGGQAHLAQSLPGRAEFGGIVTNLARELELSGARVKCSTLATPTSVQAENPDALIVATGSAPALPPLEQGGGQLVHAADVLIGGAKPGARVVVYDWRADWTGAGVAEMLAREGAHVRLAVNGPCVGAALQSYLRDEAVATLFRLGVEVFPFMRLFGLDDDSAYFLHTIAQEPVVLDDVDTVVVNYANAPVSFGSDDEEWGGIEVCVVGDALSPRTAEEAVYEGFKAGWSV